MKDTLTTVLLVVLALFAGYTYSDRAQPIDPAPIAQVQPPVVIVQPTGQSAPQPAAPVIVATQPAAVVQPTPAVLETMQAYYSAGTQQAEQFATLNAPAVDPFAVTPNVGTNPEPMGNPQLNSAEGSGGGRP